MVVISTTTLYRDMTDNRFQLAARTVKEAKKEGYEIVIVDESLLSVKRKFRELGAIVKAASKSGMGMTRRQAIREGAKLAGPGGTVIWMEPEKYPLIPFLTEIIEPISVGEADLVVAGRKSLDSLPGIQQQTEWVGNQFFKFLTGNEWDIFFGPRAFLSELSPFFLEYKGEYGDKWESIFIPILRAMKKGVRVREVRVDYIHPRKQTLHEKKNPFFDKKRVYQLYKIVCSFVEFQKREF